MESPTPEKPSENDHGWEVVENIEMSEPNAAAKNPIYRWVDAEAEVVLYYFSGADKGGLTAIPLSETDLDVDGAEEECETDLAGTKEECETETGLGTIADSASIIETMEAVEEGYRIVWNGRTTPQPVTKVADAYFEAEGNRGGRYRFFTRGTDAPYLTNLNSGRDYDVDEFEIVQRR